MPPSSPLTTARVLARHRHGANVLRDVPATIDLIADEHGTRKGGTPEEQILRQRLERIAVLARRMVENARVEPQMPVSAIVAELVRIVQESEG